MFNTVPIYWKGELSDIDYTVENIVKKGRTEVIGTSAGGRPIYSIEYGERNVHNRTANYSSALGCRDITAYKNNSHPCLMFIGTVHGYEFEGTVSLLNLISLFETGKDFEGKENPYLASLPEKCNIMIIPCANPDGRARIPYKTPVGMDRKTFREWDQGIWLDGTYCEWPDCKRYHPIKDKVKFLGGYFNDDGINPMHDSFIPSSPEVKAVIETAQKLAPDFIVQMHGNGATGKNHLIWSGHLTEEKSDAMLCLEAEMAKASKLSGIDFITPEHRNCRSVEYFDLTASLFCACGAMSSVFESDQGVIVNPEDETDVDRHRLIYNCHMVFYETTARFFERKYNEKI